MNIGAVVLAAGAGTRMGGVAKALLRRGERTFLRCIVDSARVMRPEIVVDDVVVVVGAPFGDAVAAHARELGARVVVNEDPARGMASSIAVGFAAIGATEIDAAWLWPVDHPDVRTSTLAALQLMIGAHDVARPTYRGRGGHPPLVKRAVFDRLARCAKLEHGARGVIANANVVNVDVDDAAVVEDVDS